jgi:hypothetical protein
MQLSLLNVSIKRRRESIDRRSWRCRKATGYALEAGLDYDQGEDRSAAEGAKQAAGRSIQLWENSIWWRIA